MNDTVIIIDAYLNNQSRIDLFTKTFEAVKKLNIPIILVSNTKVPDNFINNVDHYIFINRNLLFKDQYTNYPKVCFFMEAINIFRYENVLILHQKHGLSVMSNLKISSKYAEQLGYKKFIRIEWDFQINDKDIPKIKDLINNFSSNDQRAYFIYNNSNSIGLPDICYHFWMVDLKFWNENFPTFNNESDYQKYLSNINGGTFFETAERILYLSLFNKIQDNEMISEGQFYNLFENSQINVMINDINFDLPSGNGVCCGFCRFKRNGVLLDSLGLITWNRNNSSKIKRDYQISFNNNTYIHSHEVEPGRWAMHKIENFSSDLFPIKLNVIGISEHIYNSYEELDHSVATMFDNNMEI